MQALGFIYAGGFVVAMIALYVRVGFPPIKEDWLEFLLPNLPWFALMLFKAWAWPVTVGIWTTTDASRPAGQPSPARWPRGAGDQADEQCSDGTPKPPSHRP